MPKSYIRVGQIVDFDEVAKHLIVVGDISGDCFSCKHFGIDYAREKYCPGCRTDFRFISARKPADANSGASIAKLCQKRPDLTYVEYCDMKEISDRNKAKSIFK
jgi:hypothetical protein